MQYNYAVVADISCDLSSELRTRFEVDGYIKGYMSTPSEENVEGSLDLSDEEIDAFYESLSANKDGYKTAAPSVSEIVSFFETFLKQGRDILALSISSKLSSTYNLMLSAKKIASELYSDRKILIIDSGKYSIALGLLTIKACEFRAEGLDIEQNAEKLEKLKNCVHQMGTVDDLFWVASKGRISHSKAFFGTIAGIKAMGDFDSDGMVTALAKVSGYKKANKATVEYIEKTIKNAREQVIFVANSARRQRAYTLASLIEERIKPKEVIVCNVQQMSGINVGPGLVAAYYFGTEITDLKFEKEIMNDIIANKL